MRFFIALEIPESSRAEIEAVQKSVRQIFPDIRLTESNKLHITIAFIGEQDPGLKEKLVGLIAEATANVSPFFLTPAYLDGFPHLHTAHTLWIGVKGDIDQLMVIREKVKDALVNIGIEVDERRYTPHIAIAKVQNFSLTEDNEQKLQTLMTQVFSPIEIKSIKLFESIPEHSFHSHNTLAEVKLS